MVAGAEGAAYANPSGASVGVSKSWGTSAFYQNGDWLYVWDTEADGYSVQAKIQHLACANANCDGYHWVDKRTGCYDTTTIGDDGTEVRHCNYDLTENITVRVCQTRSSGGVQHGDWYCSNEIQS